MNIQLSVGSLASNTGAPYVEMTPKGNRYLPGESRKLKSDQNCIFVAATPSSIPEGIEGDSPKFFVGLKNAIKFTRDGVTYVSQFPLTFIDSFGNWTNLSDFAKGLTVHQTLVNLSCCEVGSPLWIDEFGSIALLPGSMKEPLLQAFDGVQMTSLNVSSFYKGDLRTYKYKKMPFSHIAGTSGRFFSYGIKTEALDQNGDIIPVVFVGIATFSEHIFKYTNSVGVLNYFNRLSNNFLLMFPEKEAKIPPSASNAVFQYWSTVPPCIQSLPLVLKNANDLRCVEAKNVPLVNGTVLAPLFSTNFVRKTPVGQAFTSVTNKLKATTDAFLSAENAHRTIKENVTAQERAIAQTMAEIERLNQETANAKAKLLALTSQMSSQVAMVEAAKQAKTAVETHYNVQKQEFYNALANYINSDQGKDFDLHKVWAEDGWIIRDITFIDKTSRSIVSVDVVKEKLIQNKLDEVAIARLHLVIAKPVVITPVGKNVGTDRYVAGPYNVVFDNNIGNNEVTIRLSLLDDRAYRAIWADGGDALRYRIHPHFADGSVSIRDWKSNSYNVWKNITSFVPNACQGELKVPLWKAMMASDIKTIRYLFSSFISTADANDAWGSTYIHFPKEKDILAKNGGVLPSWEAPLFPEPQSFLDVQDVYKFQSSFAYYDAKEKIVAYSVLVEKTKVKILKGTMVEVDGKLQLFNMALDEDILFETTEARSSYLAKWLANFQQYFPVALPSFTPVEEYKTIFEKYNLEDFVFSKTVFTDKLLKKSPPTPKQLPNVTPSVSPSGDTSEGSSTYVRRKPVPPVPTPSAPVASESSVVTADKALESTEDKGIPFESIVWPVINPTAEINIQVSSAFGHISKAGAQSPLKVIFERLDLIYAQLQAAEASQQRA